MALEFLMKVVLQGSGVMVPTHTCALMHAQLYILCIAKEMMNDECDGGRRDTISLYLK